MNENRIGVAEHKHLLPLEKIKGYDVRPGFYGINGATALREGVSFTVCSMEATDVELLLYHRGERKPYASCRFRSITGSEGFIPCLYSDWISMILNMHIE